MGSMVPIFIIGIVAIIMIFCVCYCFFSSTSETASSGTANVPLNSTEQQVVEVRYITKSKASAKGPRHIVIPLPDQQNECNSQTVTSYRTVSVGNDQQNTTTRIIIEVHNPSSSGAIVSQVDGSSNRPPYPLSDPHPSTGNSTSPPSYEEAMTGDSRNARP